MQALPQVETRLAQVEAWWQQYRSGQSVSEVPEPEVLGRILVSALDIAKEAHAAQEDWEPALRCIDAMLEVQRALARPAEEIAVTRINRATTLINLGCFGEARAELEACLQVFQNNPEQSATTFSALADLFARQGDMAQAIAQERRALAHREQLSDPHDRIISHSNLSTFLARSGTPSACTESSRHQLAALIYCLAAKLGQDLQTSLHNYAVDFHRAHAAGTPLTVPRMVELLADPAFRPLADWLRQRQADVAEVQAAVDQCLDMARQAALEQK
jgi:tetratricopeptide (TPR) repeat protein